MNTPTKQLAAALARTKRQLASPQVWSYTPDEVEHNRRLLGVGFDYENLSELMEGRIRQACSETGFKPVGGRYGFTGPTASPGISFVRLMSPDGYAPTHANIVALQGAFEDLRRGFSRELSRLGFVEDDSIIFRVKREPGFSPDMEWDIGLRGYNSNDDAATYFVMWRRHADEKFSIKLAVGKKNAVYADMRQFQALGTVKKLAAFEQVAPPVIDDF